MDFSFKHLSGTSWLGDFEQICPLNPELEILDGDMSAISERLTFPGTQGHVCMSTHTRCTQTLTHR